MAKAALIFATLFLLAFSSGLTSRHSNMVFSHRIADFAVAGSNQAVGNVGMLVSPSRTDSAPPTAEDAPAPALLVYLAVILVGSAIAVGMVRRSYRRQL
jgi:hypothetical protein